MTDAALEIFRVGRVQQQADVSGLTCSPALRRILPAKIPDAHPFDPEAADVIFVERTFGTPIQDGVGVQKHTNRRYVVVATSGLAGRDFGSAEVHPGSFRPSQ